MKQNTKIGLAAYEMPLKGIRRFIFNPFTYRISSSTVLETEKMDVQTYITRIYYVPIPIYIFFSLQEISV